MKLSVCNEMFEGWRLGKILEAVVKLGCDGIEIAPFTLSHSVEAIPRRERIELQEMIRGYGLECVGLHWLLVSPPGLHITSADSGVRERTQQYLYSLVEFTSDIGGKIMVFGSPKQRMVMKGVTRLEAWRRGVEVFRRCGEACERLGVKIGFEPLPRTETDFVNTAGEALRFVEEVNHPMVGITLDVNAMSREEKSIPDAIKTCGRHLIHFHANDDNKGYPGTGNVNFREVFDALKSVGYGGYISIETFVKVPDVEKEAGEALRFLKGFL